MGPTRDERDPETWLCSVADQRGFGNEFRQIVASGLAHWVYTPVFKITGGLSNSPTVQ